MDERNLNVSENLMIAHNSICDGEVYVLQQIDISEDELICEIMMTRELAIEIAKDILESLQNEEIIL